MAKKQTYEEKVIAQAADTIMQTIHIAAVRIADKYERQLMLEVVARTDTNGSQRRSKQLHRKLY